MAVEADMAGVAEVVTLVGVVTLAADLVVAISAAAVSDD